METLTLERYQMAARRALADHRVLGKVQVAFGRMHQAFYESHMHSLQDLVRWLDGLTTESAETERAAVPGIGGLVAKLNEQRKRIARLTKQLADAGKTPVRAYRKRQCKRDFRAHRGAR